MIKRRTPFAAAAAFLVLTLPVSADQISLDDLSAYLNRLKTAQADFTQINDDGTISTGKLMLKRPGRMRFEYASPDNTLVLASSGAVAIYDPKTPDNGPETYPLNQTPLSIILNERVDLARANMVVGHDYDGTATTITAQDPDHPEYGNLQLVFTGDPVQLRQWVINDDAGSSTTVVLGAMKTGVALNNRLFTITQPDLRDNR
ncbi:Outer-membrane lipoprotein carrier protein precursor [Thalassovita gelatinovora]|uniref:Outer-membrane lipoprotein carrier protein n=1 Tax=Thalassovita gelatinovora TaxID=53501 RepID=A0A0N7LUF5_THAGE|nr:outer membrane lipoprotein carrier protein LolA [Thalassovita gelatinovora]QIZ80887.1 outer membrane lipoprotein carrier protein LolA [Thalassovita gelatinovora]CUH63354.1 Outer-membrane lipoprotein carrier protein precursor [Thalassovita gelatinovora]SEQ65670.1 Outer membrane lipoprotein-sorting protein [Thalassovita gelatinovora]